MAWDGNSVPFNYTSTATNAATALFKINYYKRSENMYNSANVTLGRAKKRFDFTGERRDVATSLSFSGGVGSGSIPRANVGSYEKAYFTAKKVYAVCLVDRESIKASMDSKGAFVKATRETVQKTVESYNRNTSRILFGSKGILGGRFHTDAGTNVVRTINGVGGVWEYEITFPVQTGLTVGGWKEANWEERDFVQVVTGCTTGAVGTVDGSGGGFESTTAFFEVTAVDSSTRTVTISGPQNSAQLDAGHAAGNIVDGDCIVMQGSYENDPIGIKEIVDTTSGTLYNITVQRRWQSTQEDASGAGITTDIMNKIMLDIEKKFGKAPNLIVSSYTQFRKILNLLEDQKQYTVEPRSKDLKGKISFRGVEFMSSMGSVGIFPERFVEDDRVYFLNDNHLEIHHRPDFGWFDDDGTVFLRTANDDTYEARYGGYWQTYIEPTPHGVIHSLAV